MTILRNTSDWSLYHFIMRKGRRVITASRFAPDFDSAIAAARIYAFDIDAKLALMYEAVECGP